MDRRLWLSSIPTLTALSILCLAQNAYAYIDPGTGSYILQVLAATLLGASFMAKSLWLKLKLKLTRKPLEDDQETNNNS